MRITGPFCISDEIARACHISLGGNINLYLTDRGDFYIYTIEYVFFILFLRGSFHVSGLDLSK